MDYNKDSFLAGIAVGRQLKGWASGGGGGERPIEPINYDMLEARMRGTLNVPIESNIPELGAYALAYCPNLQSASFPNVQAVPVGAFKCCAGLVQVNIPEAAEIGEDAFEGCNALTHVSFPKAAVMDRGAFSNCLGLQEVSIQGMVTSLEAGIFSGCDALRKVDICLAVSFSNMMFYTCESLETIIIRQTGNGGTFVPGFGSNAMYKVPETCCYYIPAASYDYFVAKTAWKRFADAGRLRKIEEYPDICG